MFVFVHCKFCSQSRASQSLKQKVKKITFSVIVILFINLPARCSIHTITTRCHQITALLTSIQNQKFNELMNFPF